MHNIKNNNYHHNFIRNFHHNIIQLIYPTNFHLIISTNFVHINDPNLRATIRGEQMRIYEKRAHEQ